MATIGDLIINLRADIAQFRASMEEAKGSINSLSEAVASAKDLFEAYIGYEVINRIGEFIRSTTEAAEAIERTAQVTGIGVEQYQGLSFAAGQVGIQHDQLNTALQFFAKNVGLAAEGSKAQKQTFDQLGISVTGAQGKIKSTSELLSEFANKLENVHSPAQRAALAVEAFGRAGAPMVALLKDGAAGLVEMQKRAEALGLVLSHDELNALREANDAINEMEQSIRVGLERAVVALTPEITAASRAIAEFMGAHRADIKQWAEEAAQAVISLTEALLNFAKIVAEHNQMFGIPLAIAGGLAAIESPTMGGRAAGLAAFAAGWKMTGSGANEAAEKTAAAIDKMIAGLEKLRHAQAGGPPPLDLTGGAVVGPSRAPAAKDPLKGLDDQIRKMREQVAVLSVEHDRRNEIMRVQEVQNALEEYRGKASASIIAAKANELATLKQQLAIVQALSKSEDEAFNLRQQTQLAQSPGNRKLAEDLAVERALREANVSATDMQSAAVQRLVAAIRDQVLEQQALKDAQTDTRLTQQIQDLQDEARVMSLNAGVTREQREAQFDLRTEIEITESLQRDGLSLLDEEGRKRADLIRQMRGQQLANQEMAEDQRRFDQLFDSVEGAFENAFEQLVKGGKDFNSVLKDLLVSLEEMFLKEVVFKAIADDLRNLISPPAGGGAGGAGLGGGGLGDLLSFFSLGGGIGDLGTYFSNGGTAGLLDEADALGAGLSDADIAALAGGGMVDKPTIAMIGEAGPEMVVPLRDVGPVLAGAIAQTGGRRQPIVNQYISTPDANSFRRSSGQLAQEAHRQFGSMRRYV